MDIEQVAPKQRGWYRTVGSTNWMLYCLDELGDWHAFMLNGEETRCDFGYIAQGGPIELVAAYR